MPLTVADTWQVIGQVFAVDGTTPFTQGKVKAVDSVSGTEYYLGESGLDSSGHFTVTFSKSQFQRGDANRLAPDAIMRVYDYQDRILFESSKITLPSASFVVSPVLTRMPIPDPWHVYGQAFSEGGVIPFTQGKIIAKCVQTGVENYLGENSFDSTGHFTITFSRSQFQLGNVEKIAPDTIFRIYDFSNNLLWQSDVITLTSSEYTINPVIGGSTNPNVPSVPDNWQVSGTVRTSDGIAMPSISVKAYDVLSGVERLLGQMQTNANGVYQIDYKKEAFQNGTITRTSPNVCIKIFGADGVLVAQSSIVSQAPNQATIDVVVVPVHWSVSGTVRDDKGYLVTLGTIVAFDVQAGTEVSLGSVILSSAGTYSIAYEKDAFQRGNQQRTAPSIKVRHYYPAGTVLSQSALVENVKTTQVIDLTLAATPVNPSQPDYAVYGTIRNTVGLPVSHHQVSAYLLRITDGVFSEVLLGDMTTDLMGKYEVGYDPSKLEFPILSNPVTHGPSTDSVFIKLPKPTTATNTTETYDTSNIVCHSSKRQKIDLQVARASGSDSSEYEVVRAALTAYMSAMTDSMSREEPGFTNRLQYISCKTDVTEDKVLCYFLSLYISKRITEALAKATSKLVINTDCDFGKFMYAIFRTGKANDVTSLCSLEASIFYTSLAEAIKARIISETSTAKLPVFWAQWLTISQILTSSVSTSFATPGVSAFSSTIYSVFRGTEPALDNSAHPAWLEQKAKDELKIQQVVKAFQDAEGRMDRFWSTLKTATDPSDKTKLLYDQTFVRQLAFIYDLYSISNEFTPWAQGTFQYFALSKYIPPNYSSQDDPNTYKIQDLAKIGKDEWRGMTTTFLAYTNGEYPKQLVGASKDEQAQILATTTMGLFKKMFPTEHAAETFEASTLQSLKDVGAFLKDATDFDLDTTNIDKYLALHPSPVKDIDVQLKTVQRINRLTHDPVAIQYMVDNGLDSAYKISLIEEEKFVADHAQDLGGIDEAHQIHRLAVMYASDTLNLLGNFHGNLSLDGTSMTAVNRGLMSRSLGTAVPSGLDPVPTYETLFGTLSQANVENSQTVFSASAYYVDLLEFIESLSRSSLFSRRPELSEIDLTKKNAETTLPYIDLVLEILENAVSPNRFFIQDQDNAIHLALAGAQVSALPKSLLDQLAGRGIEITPVTIIVPSLSNALEWYLITGSWRVLFSTKTNVMAGVSGFLLTSYPQTSQNSADLDVSPEHRNPSAYEALSNLCFPLQLPLNPGAIEVKETLGLLGVEKYDAAMALRKYNGNSKYTVLPDDLICANLGITLLTKKVIDGTFPQIGISPWELWGLQATGNQIPQLDHPENNVPGNNSWIDIMSFVPEFLRRTGLDVQGMLDLFGMVAINKGNHIQLLGSVEGLQTGDPDQYKIKYRVNANESEFINVSEADFVNIHSLIRLKSILGMTWHELDSFLWTAYRGVPKNLDKIHFSKIFKQRHSIGWQNIACFWGPIAAETSDRLGKSFFEDQFISRQLDDPTTASLKKLIGSDPIDKTLGVIEDIRSVLKQSLRLSDAEMLVIIHNELSDNSLNLENITKLIRVAYYTKSINVSIVDYYFIKSFSGIDPFDVQNPGNILRFDDEVQRLSSSGVAPGKVSQLLQESSPITGDNAWVVTCFRGLREIVKNAEAFLSSDSVPVFTTPEELLNFKKNYREGQILGNVNSYVNDKFSEFTGNQVGFAKYLIDEHKQNGKSVAELWSKLATAGWTRTLGTTGSTQENLEIPTGDLTSFGSMVTWSAIFVPETTADCVFQVQLNNCEVTVKRNGVIQSVVWANPTLGNFTFSSINKDIPEFIEVTCSKIASKDRFCELLWNAGTVETLDGNQKSILGNISASSLIPSDEWTALSDLALVLPYFHKLAEYLNLLNISPVLFKVLLARSTKPGWEILLPDMLPGKSSDDVWNKFTLLLDVLRLNSEFPIDESMLVLNNETDSAFTCLISGLEAKSSLLEAKAWLCQVQNKWDKTVLSDLMLLPEVTVLSIAELVSPKTLCFILDSMPVVQRIGVSVAQLKGVSVSDPVEIDVKSFRGALQARLGMDQWRTMVTAMMNELRIKQRDALVAYLTFPASAIDQNDFPISYATYLLSVLAHAGTVLPAYENSIPKSLELYKVLFGTQVTVSGNNWSVSPSAWSTMDGRIGYRNERDMFSHFLIDVEMNTDMRTSRIVQASAAVQLFVQRAFMGLESSGTCLDDRDKEQWGWIKNYRLWEANRKVFLYPENWTEPELRDDKTPFFKELEAEFGTGDITSDIAESALSNYLGKMKLVSGLDIIGVYRGDPEVSGATDTLHIIGKTKSSPYEYFYRRCHVKSNHANTWTPWEAISTDIQGDSVLPMFFNGHLHLFWANFKPFNMPKDPTYLPNVDSSGNQLSIPHNSACVDISLSWTALVNGKWIEKKQTTSFLDLENEFYTTQKPGDRVSDVYHFRVKETSAEYLQIEVFKTSDDAKLIWCAGVFTVWHDGNDQFYRLSSTEYNKVPITNAFQSTTLVEGTDVAQSAQGLIRADGTTLLNTTTSAYKTLGANASMLNGTDEPFFLMEDSKSFFVQKVDGGYGAALYQMENVSHPIVTEFQKRYDGGGLSSLMIRETQALSMAVGSYYGYSYYSYNYYSNVLLGYYIAGDWQAWDAGQNAFELRYLPNEDTLVRPYPMDVVDFNYGSPNGQYNWELFFHAPFLIAKQLSANQRFEEALNWYHHIFDPRNGLTGYEETKRWAQNLPAGARFWNFLPFFANTDATKTISNLMGAPDSRGNMPDRQAMASLVADWKNDPFNPHLIARSRIVTYQKTIIMHYLDTLVAWADQKFRMDSLESVNEATQLYILAAEILGTRPQSIPSTLKEPVMAYSQMKKKSLDAFSNVVVQLENTVVTTATGAISTNKGSAPQSAKQALGLGPKMLFFAIPRNEKLMSYWDLLDDRLFKIRNGMNIDGLKRQLALFAPPIDPGLLVRAAAAGIDIGTALNDMFAPMPQYRFTFMVQKANELTNSVQSMGSAILSALEKKDAEEVARLRADHESTLLRLTKEVKHLQIEEATASIEGLKKSRESTEFRIQHYQELISACDPENPKMSKLEAYQLSEMAEAYENSKTAHNIRMGAKLTAFVPDADFGVSGFGGSPVVKAIISVREATRIIVDMIADGYELKSMNRQNSATRSGINAGYDRRMEEWTFQEAAATKELGSIDQQILGAQIRLQVSQKELENLEKQIAQSVVVFEFLKNKYSNTELYQWMVGELASLYTKNYQLAYDVAKRAEKSYGFELGIQDSSFIQFGYWDNLHKGLLAGERLMTDLRRMDISYVEKNKRELEITKPISIAQLNPQAILDLQEKGECLFQIPEALFDLDFPGHYFRRIRSVRLTIPCVAGPYTSVSAKLNLVSNSMRKSSLANPTSPDDYPRKVGEDSRFIDQRVGIQGIATSQPNGATGLFDFNFHDERYLPFEGAGAISTWRLELPTAMRQFDYRSITDVVLNMSYTAREDGSLKSAANTWISSNVTKYIASFQDPSNPINRTISLKRDLPDVYQSLMSLKSATFTITPEMFPYIFKGYKLETIATNGVGLHVMATGNSVPGTLNFTAQFQAQGDSAPTSLCTKATPIGSGTKEFLVTLGSWDSKTVFVTCTISAEGLSASDVDDILLSFNYTVTKASAGVN